MPVPVGANMGGPSTFDKRKLKLKLNLPVYTLDQS